MLREHGAALGRVAAAYEADRTRQEDLFQEICLALWQALPRFRGEATLRTFVFRVAHNRGLTHRMRQARSAPAGHRAGSLEEVAERPDPRPGPDDQADSARRRERLLSALRALPLPARQVLTLTLEGLSQAEIGEVLGLTENHVAVRLVRARRMLRDRLAPDSGGAATGAGEDRR